MKSFPILFSRAGFAALAAVAGISLLAPAIRAQVVTIDANAARNARPALTIHEARVRDYHVRHLKLVFDVNAKDHSAHGVVTHSLTPLRDSLATVVLDARNNLKIETCKINGKDTPFTHKDNQLTLTPNAPLAGNKEVAVEIAYSMPSAAGLRGGGANGAGGFTWIDPRPDQPARRVGFWTQGETNTNSSWVPCYDFPNDKCTSETHTTVPEEWTVIGNGSETPATANADAHTRTYHWTMKQPHSTYLLSLVGGEMDVQKDTWRGVPLYYAVPKGMGSLIPGAFGNTPDMLSWFSDNLGVKYPWPKYAQCYVADFPGGMENVSATTLGTGGGLPDARAGKFPLSSLTSHELGHQWFGDLVTCKDWGDIWLNESFATFMEMFYLEHLNGKEAYEADVDNYTRQYLASARRAKRALSTNMYASYDAMFESGHTYSKGGVILHMLRRELGDKVFFASLHRYLKTNQYQPVETADLVKAISDETHHDIKPFFDQWVFKPGHPVLDMTWTYDEGRKEVVATVKQLQSTTDGTPIYNTPLTFGIARAMAEKPSGLKQAGFVVEKSHGKSQTGSDLQRQRVVLDQATQEFHLPCAQKPALVLLDPDHDMLKEVPDTHWTDADMALLLRIAPSSIDRRLAASKLVGDSLDAGKISLFTDVLKSEPGDSLGATLIDSLGSAKSEDLRPLFRMEAQSKLPRRRAAALTALGQLPPTDEDTRLLRTVASSDVEPYAVVRGALTGLSGTNVLKNLDVFEHILAQPASSDSLVSASVDALATAKNDAIVPLLLQAVKPPHNAFIRIKAAGAIGTLAPGSMEVHDALMALLNEPQSFAQNTAIRALAARKDKGALDAIRALAATSKNANTQDAAKTAVEQIEAP